MIEEQVSKRQLALAGLVLAILAGAFLVSRLLAKPRAARLIPNGVMLEVERVAEAPANGGVWVRTEPPGTMLIFVPGQPWKASTDRGRTWSERSDLPTDKYGAMVWSNQTRHLVWEEFGSNHPLTPSRLMHRESPGGADQLVIEGTNTNGMPERLGVPAMVAVGDGLVIIFKRSLPPKLGLHAMSYSAGVWKDLGDVPDSDHDWLQAPSLAADAQGRLYLAFVRQRFASSSSERRPSLATRDLVVLRSKDRGATWDQVASGLGDNPGEPDFESYGARAPQLFVGADQVVRLLWVHTYGKVNMGLNATRRYDVLMAQSRTGTRWSSPVQVNDAVLAHSELMLPIKSASELGSEAAQYGVSARGAASPSGRYLAMVWRDFRGGSAVLTYAVSSDGGTTWTQNQAIAPELTAGAYVSEVLVDDAGELAVFWQAKSAVYLARGRL